MAVGGGGLRATTHHRATSTLLTPALVHGLIFLIQLMILGWFNLNGSARFPKDYIYGSAIAGSSHT